MKDLKVTEASFEDAMELQDAVAEALAEKDINLSTDLFNGEVDSKTLGSVLKMVLGVARNKRLRAALFSCSERSVYKNQKVNEEFFEPVKNRALYYPIMIEVLKVNLGPFFGSLSGMFEGLDLGTVVNGLKSSTGAPQD